MRVGGKHRQYVDEGEASELMSESYSRRSWKGIAIAFLVIGAVAAIVTLIVIYSGTQRPWNIEGTLTLPDVINGKYTPKSFSTVWSSSGDTFMYLILGDLWSFNITRNITFKLVSNTTWQNQNSFGSFYPSPNGEYILYSYNKTKKFRYSYNASFEVVTTALQPTPIKQAIADGRILQFAGWGPAQNDIVYVQENDLYYLPSFDKKETRRITNDGIPGIIFNGVPDWVYEEEVFGTDHAIWWSPNGKYIAFLKFNDTEVNDMHYMHYGDADEFYPTVIDIKYPKPGFANPVVSLWIYDTNNSKTHSVDIKDNRLHYVTSVTWANDNTLAVMWGPRIQNQSFVSLCKFDSGAWNCNTDSEEKSEGWLETRSPLFNEKGDIYFLIKSRDGFKHIHKNFATSPNRSEFITGSTDYEVTDILYYGNDNIYYLRTDGAEKRRFYVLSKISTSIKEKCLSCDDPNCDWVSVSVSPTGEYYALTCASPTTVPSVKLYHLDTNNYVQTWEDNQDLKNKLANQTLATYRDYSIPVSAKDSTIIKMRVWVPQNFSESKKYPALIYVYGGPGSQMVQNNFGVDFGTYLVTNKNYLYVEVDGRGSAFRGDKVLYSIYKRLGTYEIQDQIQAMRYLLRNHTFVDPSKVAIWGWSYGGYAAAMTLAQGKEIFTCAMSVAPVTSWRYYDSIYTERYMLEPDDNAESYRTSQLMNYVSDFKNKPFLLLHGTADDNVHVQQSMMFTKALNNASVLFDMHMYPDENHSIPKSKLHVYMTLEDFLSNCFS